LFKKRFPAEFELEKLNTIIGLKLDLNSKKSNSWTRTWTC